MLSVEATAHGRPEDAQGDIITALLAVARAPMPQATYITAERAIIDAEPQPQPEGLDVLDLMEGIG